MDLGGAECRKAHPGKPGGIHPAEPCRRIPPCQSRDPNLQVVGIEYNPPAEEDAVLEPEDNAPEPEEEPEVQNYELLAFEWADAHIFELNARCNEAIGENLSELILLAEELPVRESWADICQELIRAGLTDVQCVSEGIKINLTQSNAERK